MAYNTKMDSICTLADLHAQQAEFPHCIPDGIFILREDCKPCLLYTSGTARTSAQIEPRLGAGEGNCGFGLDRCV